MVAGWQGSWKKRIIRHGSVGRAVSDGSGFSVVFHFNLAFGIK